MIIAATCCAAAGAQYADDPLLAQLRTRMVDSVRRQPNYMCTQTIDRVQYESRRQLKSRSCAASQALHRRDWQVTTSDRLRVDVAVADSKEIYSWVGEHRFDGRNLVELVGYGPLSTGSYTSFLAAIFAKNIASVSKRGTVSVRGATLVVYEYSVTKEKSQYAVRGVNGKWFLTAYAGSFLVDPVGVDLVSVELRTINLPEDTGACEETTILEYSRASLNKAEVLLPTSVTLKILHPEGIATESHTAFNACHEYRAESTLTFETEISNVPTDNRAQIPVGLPLSLTERRTFSAVTASPIDPQKAAVGDLVSGQLTSPIRGSGTVFLPTGTPVKFRIVRLQSFESPPQLMLGLQLESIMLNSEYRRINATVLPADAFGANAKWPDKLLKEHRAQLILESDGIYANMGSVQLQFFRSKSASVIRKGLEMWWVTGASRH